MRRPIVAGNWKMNGTRASVAELIDGLNRQAVPDDVEVVVFPVSVHLSQVLQGLEGKIAVGSQDCASQFEQGALTGEVSSGQLADIGCKFVLVGHSERRIILGEDDGIIRDKFAAAQAGGLTPILCVGETLEQREAGETLATVRSQVAAVTDVLGVGVLADSIIAYEPVWAIGTGLTATPEQAQEVHAAIRSQVAALSYEQAEKVRIVYGGSVKAANAVELFGMPDIDGGLVGGASLNADEFGAICRAAGS